MPATALVETPTSEGVGELKQAGRLVILDRLS